MPCSMKCTCYIWLPAPGTSIGRELRDVELPYEENLDAGGLAELATDHPDGIDWQLVLVWTKYRHTLEVRTTE